MPPLRLGQHLLGDGLLLSSVHCCLLSPCLGPCGPPELLGSAKLFAQKLPVSLLISWMISFNGTVSFDPVH